MRLIAKTAAFSLTLCMGSFAQAQEAAPPAPAAPPPAAIVSAPVPNPGPVRPAVSRPAPRPAVAATTAVATIPLPPQPPLGPLPVGQAIPPDQLEAFVDGVVRTAMARDHVLGVTVSVVQNGQVVLKKGYGYASLSPARPVDADRTLFRLGPLSSSFTAIALMREVEAGRIRLGAPLNLYLPERLQIRDQGFDRPVRVAHLLDHSAGFEDRALGHLYERRADRERPLATYLRQERPDRVRAPGVVSSYSDYGAALAGAAVAYVADRPFEQLVQDQILRPLGLGRTTFFEPREAETGLAPPMAPALATDVSEGFGWSAQGYVARPFEYAGHIAPAASASSTAADMGRYMLLLLNSGTLDGVAVYGARAAQAFRTPARPTTAGFDAWRHGFMTYALPGGRQGFGLGGRTLSFVSDMTLAPDLGLGVFVSANTDTAGALPRDLPGMIVQEFYVGARQPPRAGSPALAADAGRFEGYYLTARRAHGGLEGFVGLMTGGAVVGVTGDGLLTLTRDGATSLWAPDGDPVRGAFVAQNGTQRLAFDMAGEAPAPSFVVSDGKAPLQRADGLHRPVLLGGLAALTLVASVATLVGVAARNRREHRETGVQSRASLVQNTQACLWIAAMTLLSLWLGKRGDPAAMMYAWPGGELLIASACALVAAVLTGVCLVLLPMIWRGGRRVDSWTSLRKAAFSVTTLVYLAFSVVLGAWGALSPWG